MLVCFFCLPTEVRWRLGRVGGLGREVANTHLQQVNNFKTWILTLPAAS